jgi:hypothetical protein
MADGVARLVIVATTSDGRQLVTVGPGRGRVLFDRFTFDATAVKIDSDGVVSLPADPRAIQGRTPHVHIATVGHPDIVADLDIPVRYDAMFEAEFSGAPGARGSDGFGGMNGTNGSDGSTDLNNPSAGGSGTSGSDGSGGRGGPGGSGGKGGRGGGGGNGFPPGTSGSDGRSGFDGSAGAGGAAGSIILSVDSQAMPFLGHFLLISRSGDGRDGPSPEIRMEPVAAIW